MPMYFQKPDHALKRAEDFINVGKPQKALDALYDVLKSRKHNRTWLKVHEQIMFKYLQLCVDLRKGNTAKEGLHQYKNMSQQSNVKTLEDVLDYFLGYAEKKTEEAKALSHQDDVNIDDLDAVETPQSILLGTVSGEGTQDRKDRDILTPWVKFLWEAYRQSLDLLKNNKNVERIYQKIAKKGFDFCIRYKRPTEFKKFCDSLRLHFMYAQKNASHPLQINLQLPETQAIQLETRLMQLENAIKIQLWQEAFRAIEDVHNLITLTQRPPKPSLLANYYQKMALVFLKSDAMLFHACAWHKYYLLVQEMKKQISQEERQSLCSVVLCATLAIPLEPVRPPTDYILESRQIEPEKRKKIAGLMNLSQPPTRKSLLADMVRYGVPSDCYPELRSLYASIESDFAPLKMTEKITPCLEFIKEKEDLAIYSQALKNIAVVRVIKEVSQVYTNMELERLQGLLGFVDDLQLEKVIVTSAKLLDVQVRLDHRAGAVVFGASLTGAVDTPEGPTLQKMPTEQVRSQLIGMTDALYSADLLLTGGDEKEKLSKQLTKLIQIYFDQSELKHSSVLKRKQMIERRKEDREEATKQKEDYEYEKRMIEDRKQRKEEQDRLFSEREARNQQQKKEQESSLQRHITIEHIRLMKQNNPEFNRWDEEELLKMDRETLMQLQVANLEKQRTEHLKKMKQQEKAIDHFVRAKRIEEIPLLKDAYDTFKAADQALFEKQDLERIENSKKARTFDVQTKNRLFREELQKDKDNFIQQMKESRKQQFEEEYLRYQERVEEERKKRLQERRELRKRERKDKFLKELEREKQIETDKQMEKDREEERRLEKERSLTSVDRGGPERGTELPPRAGGKYVPPHAHREREASPPPHEEWKREMTSRDEREGSPRGRGTSPEWSEVRSRNQPRGDPSRARDDLPPPRGGDPRARDDYPPRGGPPAPGGPYRPEGRRFDSSPPDRRGGPSFRGDSPRDSRERNWEREGPPPRGGGRFERRRTPSPRGGYDRPPERLPPSDRRMSPRRGSPPRRGGYDYPPRGRDDDRGGFDRRPSSPRRGDSPRGGYRNAPVEGRRSPPPDEYGRGRGYVPQGGPPRYSQRRMSPPPDGDRFRGDPRGAPRDRSPSPGPDDRFRRGPPPPRFEGSGPPPRRDFDGPPRRDFDREAPPRREFDRDGPPPQRREFDRDGPPQRRDFDRDGPPPQRREFDRDGPPQRRDFDRDGPPPQRREFDRDDGPPQRRDFDRDGPPQRREFDRDGPPQRRDFDRDGPPPQRREFDDDPRGPPARGGERGPPERRDERREYDDRRPPPQQSGGRY